MPAEDFFIGEAPRLIARMNTLLIFGTRFGPQNLKTQLCLAGLIVLSAASLSAQSMKIESGSLEFLKGAKILNVEYAYDGLTVGKDTEQPYMDKRMAEANKKEAGTGGSQVPKNR